MGRTSKLSLVAAGLLAAVAAGGCGVDTVELNGGVFDALGVSTKSLKASQTEEKLAARTGLVMPPDTSRLPPPGSGAPPVPADQNWPMGPEDANARKQAALEAEQKAICDAWEKQRAVRSELEAPEGPLGNCDPGIGERLFGTFTPGSKPK